MQTADAERHRLSIHRYLCGHANLRIAWSCLQWSLMTNWRRLSLCSLAVYSLSERGNLRMVDVFVQQKSPGFLPVLDSVTVRKFTVVKCK
jgi:hypothetical protein